MKRGYTIKKGDKFGYFTVTGNSKFKGTIRYIECECICGNISYRAASHVKSGVSKSCGCKRKVSYKDTAIRSGHSATGNDLKHPLYRTWLGIRSRCRRKKGRGYKNYGGRGIKMCDRWYDSFKNFINDVGERPSANHTLDRYPNNDGDYEPNNFRWATWEQQLRNKRNNVICKAFGEWKCITDWSEDERCEVKRWLLYARIRKGISMEDALKRDIISNGNSKREVRVNKGDIFGGLILTGEKEMFNHRLYVEYICECGNKKYCRLEVLKRRCEIKCSCNRKSPISDKIYQLKGNE